MSSDREDEVKKRERVCVRQNAEGLGSVFLQQWEQSQPSPFAVAKSF